MHSLTKLDKTLGSEAFANLGKVVYSEGKSPEKGCVIVRHVPGNEKLIPSMMGDPEYAVHMMAHQNRVRAMTQLLLDTHHRSPFIVEGVPFARAKNGHFITGSPDHNLASYRDLKSAHHFEKTYGVRVELDRSPYYSIDKPFDVVQREDRELRMKVATSSGKTLDLDATRTRPLLQDNIQGSFRQAGALIAQGRAHRVYGFELTEAQRQEIPADIADSIRHRNILDLVQRKIAKNLFGVVVIGASHAQSGTSAPKLGYYELEGQIGEAAPNTRVIVVEPHNIDRVMPEVRRY